MIVRWFLYFILYSFVGWVYESILCSIKERKLINRGFLTGPIIPVYGVGAVASIALLQHCTENIFILFFIAVFLMGTIEYVTGFLLETLFHKKWWDYSNHRYNLQGRVCLQSVLVFGAMAVCNVRFLHPIAAMTFNSIPDNLLTGAAVCFLAILTVDLFHTLKGLSKQ